MTEATVFDDALAVDLDGGEVESPDDLQGGNFVSKEGHYHVLCQGVEAQGGDDDKLRSLKLDLQILAGSDANGNRLDDQVGRSITHYLYLEGWFDSSDHSSGKKPLEEKQFKGIRAFAWAFGLLSDVELSQPKVKVQFGAIEGRQAVVKVTKEDDWTDSNGNTKSGRHKISWNNDAWPVTHDRVTDVAKDPGYLALLQGGSAAGPDLSDI